MEPKRDQTVYCMESGRLSVRYTCPQ